ncbi:MAG: lipopolysaccharide export system protein LptA [Cellvibrionaceae bacterium]|jgi:lipopolysaccharide export system protein LptA
MRLNKIYNRLITLIALSTSILISPLSVSLSEDSQQPILISSNSAIKDDKRGLTVYQGDVDIKQGSLNIKADKVTIYVVAKEVTKIIAEGKPASFKQQPEPDKGDLLAKANTIEYRVAQKKITLTTDASLDQDGSSITSDKINYDMVSARIEAAGNTDSNGENGRVNVVMPPPNQDKP